MCGTGNSTIENHILEPEVLHKRKEPPNIDLYFCKLM
jgi:hypothetical protein